MDSDELKSWARQLIAGEITADGLLRRVAERQTADLDLAQLDLDRQRRCGYPEVVLAEGKSAEILERIFRRLVDERVDAEKAQRLAPAFPSARYNALGRTIRIANSPGERPERSPARRSSGVVALLTAGTGDAPVAEEARETLLWMGVEVVSIHDVGVAGPHRLVAHLETLHRADAVVVIAGMEGALPSVVGGHVDCPVLAVPTSVGYGANFGGLAALLGMLNSCAANVAVVNIDAGFKGAYIAGMIAQRRDLGDNQESP
jgi:NCAIR mutase (PurE)-related protein